MRSYWRVEGEDDCMKRDLGAWRGANEIEAYEEWRLVVEKRVK